MGAEGAHLRRESKLLFIYIKSHGVVGFMRRTHIPHFSLESRAFIGDQRAIRPRG